MKNHYLSFLTMPNFLPQDISIKQGRGRGPQPQIFIFIVVQLEPLESKQSTFKPICSQAQKSHKK